MVKRQRHETKKGFESDIIQISIYMGPIHSKALTDSYRKEVGPCAIHDTRVQIGLGGISTRGWRNGNPGPDVGGRGGSEM